MAIAPGKDLIRPRRVPRSLRCQRAQIAQRVDYSCAAISVKPPCPPCPPCPTIIQKSSSGGRNSPGSASLEMRRKWNSRIPRKAEGKAQNKQASDRLGAVGGITHPGRRTDRTPAEWRGWVLPQRDLRTPPPKLPVSRVGKSGDGRPAPDKNEPRGAGTDCVRREEKRESARSGPLRRSRSRPGRIVRAFASIRRRRRGRYARERE